MWPLTIACDFLWNSLKTISFLFQWRGGLRMISKLLINSGNFISQLVVKGTFRLMIRRAMYLFLWEFWKKFDFELRDRAHLAGELKTLTEVETLVNARWHHLVGKTPLARFVSQICKVTLGWTGIAPSEDQTATFHSTVTTRQTSTSQLSSTSTLHR